MGRPYKEELDQLPGTLAWARKIDISQLKEIVAQVASGPLVAVGSGGSHSVAHLLALVHQHVTGQLATVATPYQLQCDPSQSDTAIWLLSAGGGNVDIINCFKTVVAREPKHLAVLCGKKDSKLALLARQHPFADLVIHELPSGKDGFLATNSMVGFAAILIRAYAEVFETPDRTWTEIANVCVSLVDDLSDKQSIWDRDTTVVLHGNAARPGAVDLESKFTEAAVGNLHFADWRNFGHGRHHWFAKHGHRSAVLALVGRDDADIAKRTLALIPNDIPISEIHLPGNHLTVALGSLLASTLVTGWAGAARGIDPGRPGVPEFGRRLYHLPLGKSRTVPAATDPLSAAAINRKTGVSISELSRRGELQSWLSELKEFKRQLQTAEFGAIVLDYDGTIVDARHRFDGPDHDITNQLCRILDGGLVLAISTGRGGSVRRDLQKSIPERYWRSVVIGYYNGAVVSTLDNDAEPATELPSTGDMSRLSRALRSQPEILNSAIQTDRPHQITLEPRFALPECRLWDLAQQVVLASGLTGFIITRSSHSIDIVRQGTTKLSVLSRISKATSGDVLTIGDRGRWPGNDYDLLRHPLSLSVDQVSVDPKSCWNLARPGQRGPAVLLDYLSNLKVSNGTATFVEHRHRKAS